MTTAQPEQFIAALTDFGSERSNIWVHSQPEYLEVNETRHQFADVTEGSQIFGGVWERLHYDWSNPRKIVLRTVDGNLWDNRSGWTYDITPGSDGQLTRIVLTVERYPRGVKGLLVIVFVGMYGKRIMRKDFEKVLHSLEGHTVHNR